jgi:hypothetical protein
MGAWRRGAAVNMSAPTPDTSQTPQHRQHRQPTALRGPSLRRRMKRRSFDEGCGLCLCLTEGMIDPGCLQWWRPTHRSTHRG